MASGTGVSRVAGGGGGGGGGSVLWGGGALGVRAFDKAHWPVDGELPKEAIDASERALIDAGALRVVTREVEQPPRVKANPAKDYDYTFFKLTAVTVLIAMAIVTIMMMPGTHMELV